MFPSRMITTMGGEKLSDQYSMYFDATNNNRVNCGSDSSLDATTSDFSVCAWFNAEADGATNYYWPIVSKGGSLSSDDNGWAINIVQGSGVPFRVYFDTQDGSGGRESAISDADVGSYGVWNHVAGVYDNTGDKLYVYLNGVLLDTDTSAGLDDIGDGSVNFYIGNDQDSRDFKGHISDVAFYKGVVLSQSDIYTLYNGREPYNHKEGVASTYLKGWWRMGDGTEGGSGSTVYDMSGNGNDGTVENGPVFSAETR